MKSLYVRDIMTSKVITIPRSASSSDAALTLSSHRISGAPVVDQGRLVGVVSKTDLLYARVSSSTNDQVKVEEVMTPLVFAVRPGDPAMLAVHLMVEEGIHRVVVVDGNYKLAGIVSSMDVLRVLARGARSQAADRLALGRVEHAEPAVAVQYVDLREIQISA
jgi:CBS domain-containing protein